MIRVAGGKQAEEQRGSRAGEKEDAGGTRGHGDADSYGQTDLRLNASPLCASGAKACAVAAEALRARKLLSAPPPI
ncbi:MAG: hypothetical protein BRC49_15615 [Cyanobacteria bacterium SW_10_48_33]|nr:MAG: hypothetical protein BRC49_15615 [Cyanobacteria bacterium SW_10_48_33]